MTKELNDNTDFNSIVDSIYNRRNFMKKGLYIGLSSFVMSSFHSSIYANAENFSKFDFVSVKANSLDTITLPKGYSWQRVISWGDPIFTDGKEFDHLSRGTGASQNLAFGDNNDGMDIFFKGDKNILVVNNEYTNQKIIYGNRKTQKPETLDDIVKGKAAHGISIVELINKDKIWTIKKNSMFNRRITADTPMMITGYAKGSKLLKTKFDPEGVLSLGTWNNCGNGKTPWGTYLACEENFNGYFSSSDRFLKLSKEYKRYGIGHDDWGYNWAKADERFDIAKHPNEPNRCGYVVEIDPLNPKSVPRKLTSLGRFKHENAEVTLTKDNRVVVYMGDDERGEFLYKYVSNNQYIVGSDTNNLLEEGTLYVAKFYNNLKGKWLELSPETTGLKSREEISVYTRIAASKVGATTMDRPEWVASNPLKKEVYCALTNNKNRGIKPNKGGDETSVEGVNPRKNNIYGQIVRWKPQDGDHASNNFKWDLFVIAGNPLVHNDLNAGSENVTKYNMFNSPDGLKFDEDGFLWIQTDGNYSNKGNFVGMGNNQMLVADTKSGKIKRFLVGPKECEITGLTWDKSKNTMFVGVQHPGENGNSNFPEGNGKIPRSSIIAIQKKNS